MKAKQALIILFMLAFSLCSFATIKGLPFTDDNYAHLLSGAYATEWLANNDIEGLDALAVVTVLALAKELILDNSPSTDDIAFSISGYFLAQLLNMVKIN